jgi:DNA-binding response OmpR family regulator
MATVLVVADNRPMQETLWRLFRSDSLEVEIASDGIAALEMFRKKTPSIVVLDPKLPGLSGNEVCRAFKEHMPSVPIVVVSAGAEVEDKVLMLELGADDYVTKPFSPKELLARVRRAIRRSGDSLHTVRNIIPNEINHEVLAFGDIRIDFTSMHVTLRGKSIAITTQELKLLKFFARSPGRVFTRDELLREVWGYQHCPLTRTVDNHILKLRQKLEPDPANPTFFLTKHGVGYIFVPSGTNDDSEVPSVN